MLSSNANCCHSVCACHSPLDRFRPPFSLRESTSGRCRTLCFDNDQALPRPFLWISTQAAAFSGSEDADNVAQVLRKKDTAGLRKTHLLLLCRVWAYASDLW